MALKIVRDKWLSDHIIEVDHDGGRITLRVPAIVFHGVTVGAQIEIPDDLSSPEAVAAGYLKLRF